LHTFGDKVYCNPGSVGQPRDGDPRAAFATFDGSHFQLHRADYDIDEVGRLMEEAGFNGYYYGGLRTGARRLQWAEP
jgi:diadenosine tetraphosphatase ApaH/serine/threonine PP2A family protein phosphatase